jgi:hypothetical protein
MGRAPELEVRLEDRCVAKIEARGGLALKLRPPTGRGFPDRLIFLDGHCFAVEFKRPKLGVVAAQQTTWRRLLTLAGFGVYFCDDDASFDSALEREMNRG